MIQTLLIVISYQVSTLTCTLYDVNMFVCVASYICDSPAS